MSRRIQKSVVSWFKKEARDLPWRKTSDPYLIWISEVMLQQTTVATVIPYYKRFIKKYSTIKKLAGSKERDVLKLWEGLGYYRRAKNLRLGAKLIVKKFGAVFPDNREDLLSIPGIGEYSAGSILSIAFRKSEAALDGNVVRVYSRFYGFKEYVNDIASLKKLWVIARRNVPQNKSETREFTEGLMELGARVCTPKQYNCENCPLRWGCVAKRENLQDQLPRKRELRKREKISEVVYFMERKGRIALCRKGADPKYPDFKRLPFAPLKNKKAPAEYSQRFKYSVTHRDFTVFVKKGSRGARAESLQWVTLSKLSKELLPAIDRKIIKAYLG